MIKKYCSKDSVNSHRGLEVIVETSKSKKEFKISKISFNGLELTEFNGEEQQLTRRTDAKQ